ncbi:ABC transporter substrate-binding protein [uncultured Tateyamaria sp.]|uniref:ABC transporter substrate-binding protein n=1 Tax=uncultured Tateyamaria sp. TaxID=455651 RepID=UPI0026335221|nr:ABC transporter substrate-binding protein [uncultured Tateyamaria sp.]
MTRLRIIAIALVSILILQWTGLVNFGLNIGTQSFWVKPEPPHLTEPQERYAIGLFYDEETYPGFLDGARQAVAEVNARGGIADSPLELIEVDETDLSWREADRNLAARRKVHKDHTIAAIGHRDRSALNLARAFFNDAGIVHINALVFDTGVGKPSFRHSISTLPTLEMLGAGIVSGLADQEMRTLAILGDRSRAGLELRVAIADAAAARDIEVVFDRTRASAQGGYLTELTALSDLGAEGLVLLLEGEELQAAVDQMALIGMTQAVVLGHPTRFAVLDPVTNTPNLRLYVPGFESRMDQAFSGAKTLWAEQGFDAVHMIAAAADELRTTDPALIASGLRTILTFEGETGAHVFDAHGRITSKPITIRRIAAQPQVTD